MKNELSLKGGMCFEDGICLEGEDFEYESGTSIGISIPGVASFDMESKDFGWPEAFCFVFVVMAIAFVTIKIKQKKKI